MEVSLGRQSPFETVSSKMNHSGKCKFGIWCRTAARNPPQGPQNKLKGELYPAMVCLEQTCGASLLGWTVPLVPNLFAFSG